VREKERRERALRCMRAREERVSGESRAGGQRSGAVAGRQARDRNVYSNGRQAGRRAVDRRLAPKARLAAPHALNSRAHRRPAVSGHG